MASIELDIQSAKLLAEFGNNYGFDQHGKWVLSAGVKLAWPESLELGSSEETDELEMRLTFREAERERVDWAIERTKGVEDPSKNDDDHVCGTVSYHAAWSSGDGLSGRGAGIVFDVFTPPEVMASLIRFAENGRLVRQVTVQVHGMEYGYAPDGSMKKWLNNAEEKFLPIVAVSYEMPLLSSPDHESQTDDPKTQVGADLAPILKESLKWLKGAVWLLAIVAGAVLAIRLQ